MFDKTFQIKGMHATYWKRLCKTTQDKLGPNNGGEFKLFERYIDAYMLAPMIGCLYGRKGSKDLPDSDDTAAMQANILINNQQRLQFIYRVIMLTDTSLKLTNEEKIDRAFRSDTDENLLKENMQLFNDYFLGGLEILYDVFINSCTTDDDYINKIHSYVESFNEELNQDNADFFINFANV